MSCIEPAATNKLTKMDYETFQDVAQTVSRLKMFPYCDTAHYIICAIAVKEETHLLEGETINYHGVDPLARRLSCTFNQPEQLLTSSIVLYRRPIHPEASVCVVVGHLVCMFRGRNHGLYHSG